MSGTGKYLMYALLACAVAQAKPLTIYWVDVEGGGGTLIVTPAGESILIDTGDAGERDATRIADVAKRAGLTQIDHVILTHWHPDHFGGVEELSKRITLKQFYDHGILASLKENADDYKRLMVPYKKITGGQSRTLNPGDMIMLRTAAGGQPVTLQCVAGSKKVITAANAPADKACADTTPAPPDQTDNDSSLAFKLTYGQFTMFDGGDLTREFERKLVCPNNLVGHVVLYQTDGHGMDASNDATFVHTLHPRIVVANNGPMKGAEPQSMRAVLSSPGVESVWQLHRNLKTPDANTRDPKLIANEAQQCSAKFIEADVEPLGGFALAIEPSGTRREYRY